MFVLVGGLATAFELPRALAPVLSLVMLAAWAVALCGVVGYIRWFWKSEVSQQSRR